MNKNRKIFDSSLLNKDEIHPYWMLGFSEGDSSFTVQATKSFSPRFSISQHKKNNILLKAISKFIFNLPFNLPKNIKLSDKALSDAQAKSKLRILRKDLSCIYNTSTRPTENQLMISNQSLNFFHIFPFFDSFDFLSRKGVDFFY
jgi:LAGLIDADG endonuclease